MIRSRAGIAASVTQDAVLANLTALNQAEDTGMKSSTGLVIDSCNDSRLKQARLAISGFSDSD